MILIILPHWDRYAPCQISRDRAWAQTVLETRVDELPVRVNDGVWRPVAFLPRFLDPLLGARLDGVELDVHVRRFPGDDFVVLADQAARIDEVDRVECFAAGVAPKTEFTSATLKYKKFVFTIFVKRY